MPEQIAVRVRIALEQKVFPGCVIGIVNADGRRDVMPFGRFSYEEGSPKVAEGTIYDLASVTKSIPVASLVAIFLASSRISLNDRVTKFIPELQRDFGATIEDLLRYRVRGPRLSALDYETFEQVRTHIFEHGFDAPPGKSEYTNLPAFLLAIVLERVGGEILPALAHKYFFGPLNMNETTFFPHDVSRVAPTEIVEGTAICGVVHDESARLFAAKRRAVGHAGLFSTAPDLLTFLQTLLKKGLRKSLLRGVVEAAESGLGWEVAQPWFMGTACGSKTFGKTGFTGTSVVVDIERGLGFVIFSNRTYPERPLDAAAINRFRSDIADIVFGSFPG